MPSIVSIAGNYQYPMILLKYEFRLQIKILQPGMVWKLTRVEDRMELFSSNFTIMGMASI
jgi:hypothetical protein